MNFSKYQFATFTVTTADPAVFSVTAHELYVDDTVLFETTNTLPTGLTADQTYYVIYNGLTADAFEVSETPRGTPVAVTAAGVGTQSYIKTNRARLTPQYENNR